MKQIKSLLFLLIFISQFAFSQIKKPDSAINPFTHKLVPNRPEYTEGHPWTINGKNYWISNKANLTGLRQKIMANNAAKK